MNIALVEDFETDRQWLEQSLRHYAALNALDLHVDCFSSGEALLADYASFRYTVIFLDIYMDGISGVETAERIRAVDQDTSLIFLTRSEEHRPEAFSVFATSYLTKPVREEDVFQSLDHILRRSTERDERFCFSWERRDHSLRLGDILSLETDRNYLVITDREGQVYRTRMTFSAALEQLDPRFLVLMRGLVVNMDYVDQIRDGVCVVRGKYYPLHMKHAKKLKQQWLNYKFSAIRAQSQTAVEDADEDQAP